MRLSLVRVLTTTALSFALLAVSMSGRAEPTGPTPERAGFAGSEACRPCHVDAWESWRTSVHVRMTQPAVEGAVLGDFTASHTIRDDGDAYTATNASGHRQIVVTAAGDRQRFEPRYTLGEKRLQGYMAPLADGRLYVLPMFWHVEWRRWVGWRDVTPAPRTGTHQQQIWNINCFNCHATNIQRNFDTTLRTFATTWTEPGVGCEACHGPGRTHIDRLTAWGKDPARYPGIDPDHAGPDFSRQLAIFAPRTSTTGQVFDSCAYCHGNKTNHFVGFTPGNALSDFAQPALMSDPVPATDAQGDFWPDGRPSRFNRPQALTESGCFSKGGATCATCHASHGSPNEHSLKVPRARADELCTQCHGALAPGHSHHAAGGEGSRCVECHMSDVNWRLLTRRRDHTFAPPVPEITAQYGVPNACTTCHEDRSPEWAAHVMDGWWGTANTLRRARALETTTTLYAAMSGDAKALPGVARLAATRTNGALIRASAAGFAGNLLAASRGVGAPAVQPAIINPLVAAAADPDATVRAAAVTALGRLEGTAGPWLGALVGRLGDTARVVRVRAAASLLELGVVSLPGEAGTALLAAQDEYAESLRTFGDEAARHTALGWLHLSRGEHADADRELQIAVRLDEHAATPHVYLGVLAARASRFDEAISQWTEAKRLEPAYPNVDAMLAEATARRRQR